MDSGVRLISGSYQRATSTAIDSSAERGLGHVLDGELAAGHPCGDDVADHRVDVLAQAEHRVPVLGGEVLELVLHDAGDPEVLGVPRGELAP